MHLLSLLGCTIIFVLYLVYERVVLQRQRKAIPLRITVTGTRGKSSVARLIASILREDGRKVVAKTTGSQARLIMPDGEEIEVSRKGIPSIIEQKHLIKKAAHLEADCLVAEIMSIHPENHYVESQQILQPHVVVVTNLRADHTEAMGETREEIAAVFCQDFSEKANVFVLENDNHPLFESMAAKNGGKLIPLRAGIGAAFLRGAPELNRREFNGNLDLVCGLAQHLGIDETAVIRGIRKARQDIGWLRIWKYRSAAGDKMCYLVNAFAANEPASTLEIIAKVQALLPAASRKPAGLLTLREDRGDRTLQWIAALRGGKFDFFEHLYVTGTHASVFRRKVNTARILKSGKPQEMMETILAESEDQAVIIGMGNMKGAGELLVDFWSKAGEVHEL